MPLAALLLTLLLTLSPASALPRLAPEPPDAARSCQAAATPEVPAIDWLSRLQAHWLLILLGTVGLGGGVLAVRHVLYGRGPFLAARTLLTAREQRMYWRIQEALAGKYVILAQVAFSQMVQAKGGNAKERYALFGKVRQKVADYVICRSDFSIVAVIELDDSSHDHKLDQDAQRDAYLKEAGIPTLRWRSLPSAAEIAKQVKALD